MISPVCEVDYLVVGAGYTSLVFADTVIHNSRDLTIAIIDRLDAPGGHWNHAYDFVKLHQPSYLYGVPSKSFYPTKIEEERRATKLDILEYAKRVVEDLVATGRVFYFPKSEYNWENSNFTMADTRDIKHHVKVRRKIIDGASWGPSIPLTSSCEYGIAPEVEVVAVNEIVTIKSRWEHFTIIGAGKTGMDAICYLVRQGINPDQITWVIPRDSWVINRDMLCADAKTIGQQSFKWIILVANASSVNDIYLRAEAMGMMHRLDPHVLPSRFVQAICSIEEMEILRRVSNVVRKGRLRQINADHMILEHGQVPVLSNTVHVRCDSNGISNKPIQPIFTHNVIHMQQVTHTLVHSAEFIARVELLNYSDDRKNRILRPRDFSSLELESYVRSMKVADANSIGVAYHCPSSIFLSRLSIISAIYSGTLRFIVLLVKYMWWGFRYYKSMERLLELA